jgi:hypothetical protein
MYYTIFHNDNPVCTVILDDRYAISKIEKTYETRRLPFGLGQNMNIIYFNDWFFGRAIPEKRPGLDMILENKKAINNRELLIKNFGLGLSDHYWIKNEQESKSWKDVNFFENTFGGEGEDIFIGEYEKKAIDESTPNAASSGMLPKKWIIQNGERYLMKGFESIDRQEPFNEKIMSDFLDMMDIDHVHYDIIQYKNKPYSLCKNMLETQNELISAYYVDKIMKKNNATSNIDHYVMSCNKLGISGQIKKELEKMIVIDYVTGNTDRHWSNFGIIRNAETLQGVRLAPLYDNGAAFYTKYHYLDILKENKNLICRSFKTRQEENIKLVSDFSWIRSDVVKKLPELVKEHLSKNRYIGKEKLFRVCAGIQERVVLLEKYCKKKLENKKSHHR